MTMLIESEYSYENIFNFLIEYFKEEKLDYMNYVEYIGPWAFFKFEKLNPTVENLSVYTQKMGQKHLNGLNKELEEDNFSMYF